VKKQWKSQSDYQRQRRMNALGRCSNAITTIVNFYDKLEADEENDKEEEQLEVQNQNGE
jgi:hypothetical protein